MSAAAYQFAAALEGFFWPKIFWDFLTKTLDPAVKPVPVLQIINLLMALFMVALEWPLGFIAGSAIHRSLEFRLIILPLTTLAAALIYQGTNSALYYIVGSFVLSPGPFPKEAAMALAYRLHSPLLSGGYNRLDLARYTHLPVRETPVYPMASKSKQTRENR
ncbi:uncharacterized protein CCOS01_07938 [Colletotrichum costaricense]|uniref:DUF7727 domain-containing protein n=1 Tax=Colletotrichum costaricense TaxID=1209916 RepID=A0AAI9YYN8_9PEZI|nr:uncharacterized protein CCOS01_07938 [Colletotrichum costaricense]KAK1527676.1 hypothetical protein CCOS01_07938 [Colletotrichum costaricense]